MKTLLSFLLLILSAAPARALDAACTTTPNLGMARCPELSEDWYESYTDQIDALDSLAKTAPSSFTAAGGFSTPYGIGAATGSFSGLISGAGSINLTGAAGVKASSFTATYGVRAATGSFTSGVGITGGLGIGGAGYGDTAQTAGDLAMSGRLFIGNTGNANKLAVTGNSAFICSDTDTLYAGFGVSACQIYGDGYSALRIGTDKSWNIDVYNSGAPKAAVKVANTGAATFNSTVTINSPLDVTSIGGTSSFYGSTVTIAATGALSVGNGRATFNNSRSTSTIFQGFSIYGGASSGGGSIQVGGNATWRGFLDFSDAGNTFFTVGSAYDSNSAVLQFKMKTGGASPTTPISMTGAGVVTINSGSNTIYYCDGGTNVGLLGRGNGGPCSGGNWVATSLKLD